MNSLEKRRSLLINKSDCFKKRFKKCIRTMNIKRNFIVILTLIVIQLSIMKVSDEQNENVSEIKERLNNLEISSQHLQRVFDNAIRIIAAQIHYPKNFVRNLTLTVGDVKLELENLKQIVEVRKNSQQLLLAEIVDDIKSRDFENAARKLRNLNGDLKKNINFIVHEVYNNQAGNFKLIIMFGQYKDIDTATYLAVYEALSFEMESNNHHDSLKLLELTSTFENRFRGTGDDPAVVSTGASEFIKKHIEIVEKVVKGEFLKAIKSNNYNTVNEIFEKIHLNYPEFFEVLIIDDIGVEKLVNLFRSYKYSSQQSIWVYSAIFDGLQKRNDLNQPSVVSLAFALKEALNDASIDKDSRDLGEMMKEGLPESVRNLAFAKRVCIKSVVYPNKYLVSDPQKHKVFIWVEGGLVENSIWLIEQRGDVYYVKNENYGEYMYNQEESSKIYTGIPDNINNSEGFKWVLQPNGRNVYIKSFDKYLYASILKFKWRENKYVGSVKADPTVLYAGKSQENANDENLWFIEDCNNKYSKSE